MIARSLAAALAVSALPLAAMADGPRAPVVLDDQALDQVTAGLAIANFSGGAAAFGQVSSISAVQATAAASGNQNFTGAAAFVSSSAFAFGEQSQTVAQSATSGEGDIVVQRGVARTGGGRYHSYAVDVQAVVAFDGPLL